MHVWRIPILLFAPLLTTALLLVVCVALLTWRRSLSDRSARAVLLALMFVALLASPAVTSEYIELWAEIDPAITRVSRHAWFAMLWSPAAVVPVLLVLAHRLFPCISASVAVCVRYRFMFFATCLTFALLNVANWCNPGWCERTGFPLPYSWWSHSVVIINGENLSAGTSVAGLLVNLAVLAFAVYAMARTYRRQLSRG